MEDEALLIFQPFHRFTYVGEVPMMYVKQQKGSRMSCDVGEVMEGLEDEL